MLNLRVLRENAKQTQRECAHNLGIPKTTFCYYEQGRTEPDIQTLVKISDFFGVSVDYLLGHETKNIMHLDSLTEQQRRAFELVLQLDYDQTNILIGRLSEMLHLPYEQARPTRPF